MAAGPHFAACAPPRRSCAGRSLVDVQRDRRHLERRVLRLSGPGKLRVEMRIVGVGLAPRVTVGLGRDQADGRVVHTLLVGMRVGFDVPSRLLAPPRHDLPSVTGHPVGSPIHRQSVGGPPVGRISSNGSGINTNSGCPGRGGGSGVALSTPEFTSHCLPIVCQRETTIVP